MKNFHNTQTRHKPSTFIQHGVHGTCFCHQGEGYFCVEMRWCVKTNTAVRGQVRGHKKQLVRRLSLDRRCSASLMKHRFA